MKIDRISLKGLGPKRGGIVVRDFSTGFGDGANVVIGINGCGKTHLLRVIAGVCGTDEATQLLTDLQVEECVVEVINDNGQRIIYEAKDGFDVDKVAAFKALLSHRVNFPLTEWNVSFPSEVIDLYTARDRFSRLIGESALREMFRISPGSVCNTAGDGFTRMLRIISGDGAPLVPTLLEYPEHHLDIMNKRLMAEDLCDRDRQVIYTTHAPEMLPGGSIYRNVDGPNRLIDMSQ